MKAPYAADASRTVVWIASYPKSGNTWLRFLICNLIFGPQESAAGLSRLAPDLHELRQPPEPPRERTLFKTHFMCSPQLPLLSQTRAAIYVQRHPADVMLSNFHYSRRSSNATSTERAALDQYFENFVASRGDPRWLKLGMGTWGANVSSWIGTSVSFPVLVLRYEDLLADAVGQARRLAGFLGIERDESQIKRAVASASFERMREIEQDDIKAERQGIFYKPYLRTAIDTGLRFMRAGRAGDASGLLSPEQQRRFDSAFGADMKAFGYLLTPSAR